MEAFGRSRRSAPARRPGRSQGRAPISGVLLELGGWLLGRRL